MRATFLTGCATTVCIIDHVYIWCVSVEGPTLRKDSNHNRSTTANRSTSTLGLENIRTEACDVINSIMLINLTNIMYVFWIEDEKKNESLCFKFGRLQFPILTKPVFRWNITATWLPLEKKQKTDRLTPWHHHVMRHDDGNETAVRVCGR